MRRLLIVSLMMALASPAFAQKTKTQLNTEIDANFLDNVVGNITPQKLRTVFKDVVASYVDWLTCTTRGSMLIWGASAVPTCFNPGTSGQLLKTMGAGVDPVWSSAISGISIDDSPIGNSVPDTGKFTLVGIGTSIISNTVLNVTGPSGAYDGTGLGGITAFTTGTGLQNDNKIQFGFLDNSYGWIQAVHPGVFALPLMLNPGDGGIVMGDTVPDVADGASGSTRIILGTKSSTTTTIGASGAAVTIANSDQTLNNSASLNFATRTGANTTKFTAGQIVTSFGTRTNGQFPTGEMMFLTAPTGNVAPTEKMRITHDGKVGIASTIPSALLDVRGSIASIVTTTTASGALTYLNGTILCNAASGDQVITLEAASSTVNGRMLTVKKIDSTANLCTVSGTIDGGSSVIIGTQYMAMKLQANASQWWVVQ